MRRLTGDYRGAAEAWKRRWTSTATSATGSVRPTPLPPGDRAAGDWGLPGAAEALEEALGIYRDIGYRLGQANALNYLGNVRQVTGDYRGAAQALEQALGISRDIGYRRGEANVLTYLGNVRRMTGDYLGAAQALEQALGIYRDIGDRGGEAETLNETGALYRVRGDPAGPRSTTGRPWP